MNLILTSWFSTYFKWTLVIIIMKTNKINCHQLTKSIFEKFINDTKKILMLIFFVGFSTTGAFAQNSCLVTGYSASPPFPTAVIESCASGSNLIYLASPSIASTFIWSLSLNTSGLQLLGRILPIVLK